jgi:DNA-binding NtrC family response regulator
VAIPKVLVIDDEPDMCWALEKALRPEGYEVSTATSGSCGLELLAKQGADLVLLDVVMPRMGGLEVLDRIRRTHPKTLVIIITGYSTLSTALDAIEKGAIGYITKPFIMSDLKAAIRKTLEASGFASVGEEDPGEPGGNR